MSDHELIQMLQSRETEEQGFRDAYQAYSKLVLYVARQYGLADEFCEELLHDVFMRLLHQKAHLKADRSLKAWLCTTARNLAVDIKRKHRKEILIKTTVEKNIAVPMLNPQVVHNVECKAVAEIINEISIETKDDSLKLFYIDGLKAREIAEIKEVEISTVTTNLTRLRRRFKERIKMRIQEIRESVT